MSDAIAHAKFEPVSGQGAPMTVQFNPASLQYTVTNTLKEEGSGNKKKQFVTQSTGKLTMDLVFDTTHVGQDVRDLTEQLAKFMEPVGGSKASGKRAPAVVNFRWGSYVFKGMVESYKETIDFFASDGVPLRATVNLTLSQQDVVFEPGKPLPADDPEKGKREPVEVPTTGGAPGPQRQLGGGGQYATQLGASAGDTRAGRAIAAANGQESMRFSTGAALSIDASIELGPPVAFASGGAGISGGIGAGAGLGIGVSAGAGVGIGVGGGISAGAGIGVSGGVGLGASAAAFGGRASAGVSASAGAFSGLRSTPVPRTTLDVERLVRRSETVSLGVDDTATFSLGGQASIQGSASLSADVGASTSLRTRIQFREE
jgi:hypothetical protein